jgi:hypothetical protein
MLVETGRAKTTEDLVRYAEQDKQVESANFLRGMAVERIPVDLAFDALSVNLRMIAHKRNNSLLEQCLNRKVGLVLPLPPHVIEAFCSLMEVTILQPDEHHLPLALENREVTVISGSREARQAATEMEALVFEAYSTGPSFIVDAEVADVVDHRIVRPDVFLVVHLRPHQNPNDVELVPGSHQLHVL